jgi:glycosyltransferase involved in cell wall biosynthesis
MLGLQLLAGPNRPDIVHTHMAWYHATVAEMAARLRNVRTLVKFACSGPDGEVSNLSRTWHGRLTLEAIRRADRVIALTDAVADELVEAGFDPSRIRRIPNGVDLPSSVPSPAPDLDNLDGPIVLFLGRLTAQKGILTFLESWAAVAGAVDNATLVIAGTGDHEAAMRARIQRSDLRGRVRYLGHRTDVPALIAAADAVVLPSRSEGMSNVALQALSLSTPVFGFAIPGVQELVASPLALAPPGDHKALGALLRDGLSAAALLRELGAAGKQRVESVYAIDRVAGQYADLYDELAA